MQISIITLFPEMFSGPFAESIIKKAQEKKLVEIRFINIRDFGLGKHKIIDDKPFGGGTGMVMRVDVLDKALQYAKNPSLAKGAEKTVLLDPRGNVFKQKVAENLAKLEHLILICGHYEGFDERIRDIVDETISIGDFVLTGGEIPAMTIADSVVRLIPGVLKKDATKLESFSYSANSESVLLEYPQYTLPREYNGKSVPEVLISGNHKAIENWQKETAKKITSIHRPDLIEGKTTEK